MKISEIERYINSLESEIEHGYVMMKKELFDILEEVFSSNKEFQEYQNDFYDYIKGIKDIKTCINNIKTYASIDAREIIKVNRVNNYMSIKTYEIPKKLFILIKEKL